MAIHIAIIGHGGQVRSSLIERTRLITNQNIPPVSIPQEINKMNVAKEMEKYIKEITVDNHKTVI